MKKLSPILLNRIIVALSLAIFLVGAMDYWFFTVEDAYISFRYCDHMLQGRGLVFNPGEPVEGYTNFLWIMTIALTRLAVPFPLAAKLPGFIFGMALILMLGRWRMDTKTYSCAGPLAALLTAACPGVQMWAVAGLETILFSLCITAGFLSAARTTLSARMISGLLFGLATLTRPEGILFFGVFLVVELVPFPGRKQAIGAAVAGFCLVVIPHQIFRVIYYHAWIPNTYWVKSQRFRDGGTAYFIRYAAMTGVFSFPLALIGLITNRAARIPRAMTAAGCVYLAYVFYIGGDWMAYGRFLIPAIPLIAPAAAATVFSIRRPMAQAVFGLMFGFAFLVSGVSTEYDLLRQRPTRYRDILTWESEHMTDWKAVALWLKENMPKHYVLCTGLAGIIPYYSELTVIDRGGLNDREIAQIVYTSIGMDEENRRIEAVLVDRRPDIMLPEERSFQMVSDRPPIQQRQSMQLESLQRMYTHRIESLNGRFFAFYQLKP